MKERTIDSLNKQLEKNESRKFNQKGYLYSGDDAKVIIGPAFYCDFGVGGYTTPTVDLSGFTVAVGFDEGNGFIHIYSNNPRVVINTSEKGWRKRFRDRLNEAFNNPGSFIDYELELGRREYFNNNPHQVVRE